MIRVIPDHTDPDPDHLKGTHPNLLEQRVGPTTNLTHISIFMVSTKGQKWLRLSVPTALLSLIPFEILIIQKAILLDGTNAKKYIYCI